MTPKGTPSVGLAFEEYGSLRKSIPPWTVHWDLPDGFMGQGLALSTSIVVMQQPVEPGVVKKGRWTLLHAHTVWQWAWE